MTDTGMYSSYLEIDMGRIRDSIERVRRHIGAGCEILPVIKSNCYGLGTEAMAEFYTRECGMRLLSCAQVSEGAQIRSCTPPDTEILVLSGVPLPAVKHAVRHGLQLSLYNEEGVRALSAAAREAGRSVRAQIKIETGMNRIGARPGEELARLICALRECGNIEIVGAFTHFATASEPESAFTREQLARFREGLAQLDGAGICPEYVHCCNSGGTAWLREAFYTHVRCECLSLGYPCMDDGSNLLGVREPASWRAFVTNIRRLMPGESAGYDRAFMAEHPTDVAVISAGYGDGLYRPLASRGGPVIVGDVRTRYLAVCMDQSFVDVTGIDCRLGDEVTLLGESAGGAALSLEELKRLTGQTLTYPLTMINSRVARVYKY